MDLDRRQFISLVAIATPLLSVRAAYGSHLGGIPIPRFEGRPDPSPQNTQPNGEVAGLIEAFDATTNSKPAPVPVLIIPNSTGGVERLTAPQRAQIVAGKMTELTRLDARWFDPNTDSLRHEIRKTAVSRETVVTVKGMREHLITCDRKMQDVMGCSTTKALANDIIFTLTHMTLPMGADKPAALQTPTERIRTARHLLLEGNAAYQLKEYDKAENLYREAIETAPDYLHLYGELAALYTLQNKEQAATDIKEQAEMLQKVKDLLDQGHEAYENRDWLKAQSFYREAIGRAPKFLPLYIMLSDAYEEGGNRRAAIRVLEDTLKRFYGLSRRFKGPSWGEMFLDRQLKALYDAK